MAHSGKIWANISTVATEEMPCYYCRFDVNLLDLTAILRCWYILPPRYAFRPRAQARGAKIFTCGVMSRRDICLES